MSGSELKTPATLGNERGAVLALTAVSLVVFLLFLGLALDTGWTVFVRSQGQAAVDMATLSGTTGIPDYNEDGIPTDIYDRVAMLNDSNDVRGQSPDLTPGAEGADTSVECLIYDQETDTFTQSFACEGATEEQYQQTNAVRVVKNAFVTPLFLSGIRGMVDSDAAREANLRVGAVGYLGCPGQVITDGLGPIAFRRCKINFPEDCDETFNFTLAKQTPEEADNSAFTAISKANANACRNMVNGEPPDSAPESVSSGDEICVNNGQVNSCLNEMEQVYGHCSEASCEDPVDESCVITVPVVKCREEEEGSGDSGVCSNKQTSSESSATVVGFASFCIQDINSHGNDKFLKGALKCGEQADGSTTGGECLGTRAQSPILIR